ncbi:hypothetical protein V6Z11_D11G290400 [Gossypium hirsutum]
MFEQEKKLYLYWLNILNLSSNALYGRIGTPKLNLVVFPKLRIIDLSHNRFNGTLPWGYFERWISISSLDGKNSPTPKYMLESLDMRINVMQVPRDYDYPMTITDKGMEMEIPVELSTQLTFLAFLNVSYNCLTGFIPRGNQFEIFQSNSFEGNLGMCGKPLLKECSNISGGLPLPSSTFSEEYGLDWKVVVLDYGCGFLFGAVIGYVVIKRKPHWFAKAFSKFSTRRRRR